MRILFPFVAAALVLGFGACEKDDGSPPSPSGVSITFRTDSGYTAPNDTVAVLDTLHIAAVITEGEDPLETCYLSVSFDNAPAVGLDTVEVDTNPFTYETVHVTRAQAGTEELVFTVEENDGDRTTRRLKLTVQ